MCDPLTIAGIALTAGSTVVNSMAQNKVKRARSDVMEAERIRQGALDKEAAALNVGAQNRYQDFPGQQEQKSKELGDYFAGQDVAAAAPAAAAELPASTSDIVVQEEAKQKAGAKEYTDQQGAALGGLRAFGDVLGDISRKQANDAGLIGQIGGFKTGSSGIVPFELENANEKGKGLNMLGDVLNLAGTVAMGAGVSGGNLPSWLGGKTPTVLGAGAGPWGASLPAVDPWAGMRASVPIPKLRSQSILDLYGNVGR